MNKKIYLSVFCVSIAVLAAEMGIIRYMSAANSSSFAAMMISIALLGFGVSGTILTVWKEKIERHIDMLLCLSALVFAFTIAWSIPLSQLVEFVPQSLQQDNSQIMKIGQYYLIFFIPFFFGSLFINLTFLKMKSGIGALYFFNLLGSGIGALAILLLMSVIDPQNLMLPVVLILAAPSVLLAPSRRWIAASCVVIILSLMPFIIGNTLSISPYKDISYALKFPDAKVSVSDAAPTGYIQVVESSQFHFAPGLSLSSYDVETPNQPGLFIDGVGASGVARPLADKESVYIKSLPFAIPFALKKDPGILILGSGGGNPVLFAKKLGAKQITAVEPNAPLVSLLRKKFPEEFKSIFSGVDLVVSDGRSYCERDTRTYDIVMIPAMLSSGMSFSSGSGNGENYLFTREAFRDYYARLNDNGVIAISMNVQSPPRSLLKLEALAFDFARTQWPDDFAAHVVMLRGLDWGTILVKKDRFTADDIKILKKDADDLTADFSYYPGIKESEINQNNMIEEELYYKLAVACVAGKEKEFTDGYYFNIEPPTDNRPFFDHNLKARTLARFFGAQDGVETLPFSEWGYLVNWATLAQGILFSIIIILIPIIGCGRTFMRQSGKLSTVVYFSMLGLGFMLVEISVIQKLTLVIANPLISVAIVISSILIFSGIGSRMSSKYRDNPSRGIAIAVGGVAGSLILHVLLFAFLSPLFLSMGDAARIAVAVVSLVPVGFFMGMPFPLALQILSDRNESFLPWGLAVNGSVSVFAAVFTSILSMHLGFTVVIAIAIICYVIALIAFPGRWIGARSH
jgi:spermidine synthase